MSETITKKVTLEDLIKRKEEIQSSRNKSVKVYIKSLDGYVVLATPDRKLVADSLECTTSMESNVHLIYNSMIEPNLKDKDTQKAFNVHTPKELLQAILSDGEIGFMAEELMNVSGYDRKGVKLVQEIKN